MQYGYSVWRCRMFMVYDDCAMWLCIMLMYADYDDDDIWAWYIPTMPEDYVGWLCVVLMYGDGAW